MKNYLLIFTVIGLSTFVAKAQYVSNYRQVADRFYAQGDYYSAAQYYEKYLTGKSPGRAGYTPYMMQKQGTRINGMHKLPASLVYRLADSYYQLNDFTQAEPWYKMLVDKYSSAYPQARYWYAACLRAKGDYTDALQQLEAFMLKYPVSDQYSEGAQRELDICLFIRRQLNNPTTGISIEKLNANINKEGASYAAGWLNNNTLVFTSTRSTDNMQAAHTNALYKAPLQNDGFGLPEKMNTPALQNKQIGAASFTADGSRMYFTGWLVNEAGEKKSAIYLSERKGDSWGEPVLISSTGYNSRQPQISPDGKFLLFASNCPGGLGGYDIWYAELDNNGRANAITNMGPAINTAADEEAPFYHAASKTLVFASKGRVGMGGYDLFTSTGSLTTSWSAAVNMGYPINSVKDDTYFISRSPGLLDNALFSSDRSSSCCLELFSIHKDSVNTIVGR